MIQANQFAQTVVALTHKPVYVINSGTAAGPARTAFLGSIINEPNLIVGDMETELLMPVKYEMGR